MILEKILKNINEFALIKKVNEIIGAHNDLGTTVNTISDKVTSLETSTPKIDETNLVHLNNTETITGDKILSGHLQITGNIVNSRNNIVLDTSNIITNDLSIMGSKTIDGETFLNGAVYAGSKANPGIMIQLNQLAYGDSWIQMLQDSTVIGVANSTNDIRSTLVIDKDAVLTSNESIRIECEKEMELYCDKGDIQLGANGIQSPTFIQSTYKGTDFNKAVTNVEMVKNIAASKPITITVTLDSTKWTSNKYTITNNNITENTLIIIGLPTTATGVDIDNLATAKLNCSSQAVGSMELTAFGTVPTTNITLQIAMIG